MAEGQGRSSNQGVKLLYIRDYLHKYTNKEHPKSAKEICKYLASKGIKADRKTIYNDILRLQVDFQEPIEYNPKKWGYYVSKPDFDAYEIRLLLDSIQMSHRLTSEETYLMMEKVLGLINIYDREKLAEQIKQREATSKMSTSTVQKADIISRAISEGKQISFRRFRYVKERNNKHKEYIIGNNDSEITIVSPQKLVHHSGRYYLEVVTSIDDSGPQKVHYDLDYLEDVKILSLEREVIKAVPITGNNQALVLERADYTVDRHRKYAVTILFPEPCIKLIYKRYGPDIPIIPYDEDNVMVTVHTLLDPTFYHWLIGFRDQAKILSPKEAIGELFHFLHCFTETYEYGTPNYLQNIPTTYDEMRMQKHKFKHQRRYKDKPRKKKLDDSVG